MPTDSPEPGRLARRGVLRGAALAGLAAMVPARVAAATSAGTAASGSTTRTFTGRSPFGFDQWAYVPFEVEVGARRIAVTASYEEFAVPGVISQVLDLGLFDQDGWGPGAATGFRGWSGGARREFAVSATEATPGYLAGPIEAGTWAVALGPIVLNPLGMAWEVTVTVEYGPPGPDFEPAPAPDEVPGSSPGWYHGDLHVHSVHSDGTRQPAEVVAAARAAGLDFFASTEHNTRSANLDWGRHAPADLLVVPGEEVTTRHGHWLALGLPAEAWVDWRYRPADGLFPMYAAEVRAAGGLVAAAHPGVPLSGSRWDFGFEHVDAIEVWNSTWGLEDEAALALWHGRLRAGQRLCALAASDSHRPEQPLGSPRTVVRADGLGTRTVVAGLRAGRAYLAESAEVRLDVRATTGRADAGIGDELAVARGDTVRFTATVSGASGTVVVLHSALGPLASAHVGDSGVGRLDWAGRGTRWRFLRVEVRRRLLTQVVALSNPVRLTGKDHTFGRGQ